MDIRKYRGSGNEKERVEESFRRSLVNLTEMQHDDLG